MDKNESGAELNARKFAPKATLNMRVSVVRKKVSIMQTYRRSCSAAARTSNSKPVPWFRFLIKFRSLSVMKQIRIPLIFAYVSSFNPILITLMFCEAATIFSAKLVAKNS